MTVKTILRRAAVSLVLCGTLAAVLAGCAKINPLTAPSPDAGTADYSNFVAMGTNLSAGFQSGGLVDRHQTLSYVTLFSKQAGEPSFNQPLVNLGGWPPLLKVKSFGPPLMLDSAGIRGAFINPLRNPPVLLDSAYHNMSIPGALLADVLDSTLNYNVNLGRDVSFFYNIARQQGRTPVPLSILQLVANKKPTFVSFEYGLNEVLGSALRGSGTPAVPAAVWGGLLQQTLGSLDARIPAARKLIVTVPNVTLFPYFRTLPPVELTATGTPLTSGGFPVFLTAASGVLQPGDLVTLAAADSLALGVGYRVGDTSYLSGTPVPGNGRPLPDRYVLTVAEQASLIAAVDGYNSAIASQATARNYALLDLHGLVDQVYSSGYHFAGVDYTADYLTGGLFSVDGIHPTDFFHGLLCNAMSDAVHRKFGSRIPVLDLASVRTLSSSSVERARSDGPHLPYAAAIPLWRLGAPLDTP